MAAYRSEVIKLARSWIGLKESDGSYKKIIDVYNSFGGKLPRNLKMQYGWSWCACTWSAIAIKLGYTDIMPIEISCGELIKAAEKMGIWVENDAYIPQPGDGILYDWDDSGKGDCTGWPDHVGVVEEVNKESGYITVIEGNYKDSVKRRTISINARYIRGFIVPKYSKEKESALKDENSSIHDSDWHIAHEVIAGKWGIGDARKKKLEKAGYVYEDVQRLVNHILNGCTCEAAHTESEQPIEKRVKATCLPKHDNPSLCGEYETKSNLYCRNDIGTNKKALCKIPKGTKVTCEGDYGLDSNYQPWLWIRVVLDGVQYTGYSCGAYLKRI